MLASNTMFQREICQNCLKIQALTWTFKHIFQKLESSSAITQIIIIFNLCFNRNNTPARMKIYVIIYNECKYLLCCYKIGVITAKVLWSSTCTRGTLRVSICTMRINLFNRSWFSYPGLDFYEQLEVCLQKNRGGDANPAGASGPCSYFFSPIRPSTFVSLYVLFIVCMCVFLQRQNKISIWDFDSEFGLTKIWPGQKKERNSVNTAFI